MRKTAVKFLIIATVLLLMPCAVFSHDYPHDPYYGCAVCHKTHVTLGSAGTQSNICMSCHRASSWNRIPGTANALTFVKSFSYIDMANPFNNDTGLNRNPNKMQTSHKWIGPDNVPAAGALPPTNPEMHRSTYIQDSISCFRCHNIKDGQNPDTVRYLRDRIDEDQLCFDCHRSRNHADHLYGTHPVNFSYTSSKVRTKPDEYYPSPVNTNPSNPSSNLKLKNGKVVCMTCHGIHFTDSNSATMDNFSSIILDRLSSSRGNLLRTDQRRGAPTERNICMNCHRAADILNAENQPENPNAKVKNHNGKKKNQNVQCVDCHGGHVEYAGANAPQEELTPNIYLINRYMNLSSPTGAYPKIRNKKVLFQNLTSKNYNREYGVCVACHTPPAWVSQHSSTDAKVCATCHKHSAGFSADCTTCHGYPPENNISGGAGGGYADSPYKYSDYSDVFKDESMSPHKTHAGGGERYSYKCDECHKGNSHATGTFQDVFRTTNGVIAGALAHYSTVRPGTCKTVYCHSDGSGTYKSPTWENGRDTMFGQSGECSSCHEAKPVTKAHPRHVAGGSTGKSFLCYNCHGETADSDGRIIDNTKHVNGAKNVSFRGTLGVNEVVGCITCHNDGNGGMPVIGRNLVSSDFGDLNNGKCGTCHAYPMTNSGHPAHLYQTYGPQLGPSPGPSPDTGIALNSCSRCHEYTGELADSHVNGSKQTDAVKCYICHPGGGPTWTAGVRLQCESCHTGATRSVFNNITAPDKSQAALTGHGKSGINRSCTDCHNNNAQHLSSNPASHTFRLLTTLSGAALNKECKYCHDDANTVGSKFRNMSTHFKKSTREGGEGTGQKMECWQCHDPHGTTNNSMIRTKIAYKNSTSWTITFLNRSTAMVNKDTNRGLCQVCHTKTKFWKAGMSEEGHPDRNCFECHRHNNLDGAFSPKGGQCNFCHGYPPIPKSSVVGPAEPRGSALYKQTFGTMGNFSTARFEDYSGGGGAHMWHVSQTAKPSEQWNNCAVCHSGGNTNSNTHQVKLPIRQNIANITLNINPRFRFNDTVLPKYTSAKLVNPPAVNQTGSCINVMCHFQQTPRWSLDR